MSSPDTKRQVREAGARFRTIVIQLTAAAVVLVIFLGIGFLVYREVISAEPLLILAGIIIGYLLRTAQDVV